MQAQSHNCTYYTQCMCGFCVVLCVCCTFALFARQSTIALQHVPTCWGNAPTQCVCFSWVNSTSNVFGVCVCVESYTHFIKISTAWDICWAGDDDDAAADAVADGWWFRRVFGMSNIMHHTKHLHFCATPPLFLRIFPREKCVTESKNGYTRSACLCCLFCVYVRWCFFLSFVKNDTFASRRTQIAGFFTDCFWLRLTEKYWHSGRQKTYINPVVGGAVVVPAVQDRCFFYWTVWFSWFLCVFTQTKT